jgi:hypothetical protein
MKKIKLIWLIMILILFVSCSRNVYETVYPTLNDGKYDTEFPYKNCSKQLAEIAESIKMLNCIVYYKTYIFDERQRIKTEELNAEVMKNRAIKKTYIERTASGTATIIYHDGNKIAVLTCAHIVDFPDTLISYFPDPDSTDTNPKYIQSISIRERQINFVTDIPGGSDFEIIAMDKENDIAVLGKTLGSSNKYFPVFDYPIGNAKELEWGSFVYIIGYPIGYQMITRAIVSKPYKGKAGAFLIDALFNRGFSGGLVLAIRDGVPNFELVGIAKSASADHNYFLSPSREAIQSDYDSNVPYTGDSYIKLRREINYGITYSISAEVIQNFFRKREREFWEKGYDFRGFLPD